MAQRLPAEHDAEIDPHDRFAHDFADRDFAETVRRHQSMVYSIALHFLADRSAAEELAQDVFLQLHASLPTLKSGDHVKFWLRKVTSHRCIDYKRSRRATQMQVSLEEASEPAAPPQLTDLFLQRKLQQLVASLPEKQRMVMILRYQEDMTPEDIAETLTMPVATVKSHLQRSLAILREKAARTLGEVSLEKRG
jgi:RNA polymerase sigma-70 factor (ECF subfamily)